MRLLSDFDGVWTHPAEEAASQGAWMDDALVAFSPAAAQADVRAWIAAARAAVAREPRRYGWAPGARLTAFGDEDPFAPHSALLHYLHEHRHEATARVILEALAANGHASLEAFGGFAHAQGVQRVVDRRGPAILPESKRAGDRLLAAGIDVVVVSNSGTDKLVQWFTHAGLPNRVHPDGGAGQVRLRGGARKFMLDPQASDLIDLEDYRVETARPAYAQILEEEAPDAVVGDVFSLDLALPLALKRRRPAWRNVRLFWLVRDYTPARLREAVRRAAPEVEALEGGLPAVAEALAGA